MKQVFVYICSLIVLLSTTRLCAETMTHILEEGETLYSLSQRYDVPLAMLIAVNKIEDPKSLAVGTGIHIPGAYRVEKGDTLYGIAISNGISLQELLDLNHINQSHILHPGDLIHIPGSRMTVALSEKPEQREAGVVSTEPDDVADNQSRERIDAESTVESAGVVEAGRSESLPQTPGPEPDGNTAGKTNEVVRIAGEKPPLWPHEGERTALSGKLRGTQIRGTKGDAVVSVSSGTVVWIAPFYGYGEMVIVQSDDSHTYTYAGNEKVMVSVGNRVSPGTVIGRLGVTPHEGDARVFFAVFKDGMPIDPEAAPRL